MKVLLKYKNIWTAGTYHHLRLAGDYLGFLFTIIRTQLNDCQFIWRMSRQFIFMKMPLSINLTKLWQDLR